MHVMNSTHCKPCRLYTNCLHWLPEALRSCIIIIIIIIIIIWGANHPYPQLLAELRRTRLHRFREAGLQGRFCCQPHQPLMTTEHSQRSKVFDFSWGRKTGWSGKPLWHSREPTHNSTHIWPWPGTEPESPWWEASALLTSQPCHPLS